MGARDPHGAHLGVEPVGERLAQRVDAPAHPRPGLEHDRVVAGSQRAPRRRPAPPCPRRLTTTPLRGDRPRRGSPAAPIPSSASCASDRMPIRSSPRRVSGRRYNPACGSTYRAGGSRHEGRHAADRDRLRDGDVADQVRPRRDRGDRLRRAAPRPPEGPDRHRPGPRRARACRSASARCSTSRASRPRCSTASPSSRPTAPWRRPPSTRAPRRSTASSRWAAAARSTPARR